MSRENEIFNTQIQRCVTFKLYDVLEGNKWRSTSPSPGTSNGKKHRIQKSDNVKLKLLSFCNKFSKFCYKDWHKFRYKDFQVYITSLDNSLIEIPQEFKNLKETRKVR